MANALQTNPAYLFFAALAAAINIFAPLVIALAARRALNLS
ncbi:MAG TPA: hypothetical protein PL074_09935 [Thermoflexales bacterium]|nr:hypothetical protein [Thermoflexales bacterium]